MNGMLLVLGGLGLVVGCAGPGSGPPLSDAGPDIQIDGRTPIRGRVPIWAGHPLAWDKLRAISDWLQREGTYAEPYWVVEGHLQLAEGRLHYSHLEATHASERRSNALQGFHRVLAHPDATASQRSRADVGLSSLEVRPIDAGAPVIPGVLPRRSWGARSPNLRRLDPASARWRWITVHHSAEPGARPLNGTLNGSAAALRDIQSAHMNGEGYGDIGYHFVIDPSGRVFEGRDLRHQGAHAGGENNVGNVGVCLLGNFDHHRPTSAALESMHGLIDVLQARLGLPHRNVRGHHEWKSTACPGRYLKPHLARYDR